MKHFLISVILCMVLAVVHAQRTDSLRYIYNNQTIYRYGSYFMKGNERLTFSQLQQEFVSSELGLAGYGKAKTYKTINKILGYAAFFAAGGVAAFINKNRNTAYAFIGGEFILLLGASRYSNLSNQSLDRALWQRNKDVLFPHK